jgi:hypothetical protein
VVFSLGSILRARCGENIFPLIIIIKYKIPGAISPGVRRSGREAEIQPELQKGKVVMSRHVLSLLCPWRHNELRAGQPGFDSRQGQNFSLPTTPRPVLGPTQHPIQ